MLSISEHPSATSSDHLPPHQSNAGEPTLNTSLNPEFDPHYRLPINFRQLIERLNSPKIEWVITTPAELFNLDLVKTIRQITNIRTKDLNPSYDQSLPANWQEMFTSPEWLVFAQWQPLDEQENVDLTVIKASDIVAIDNELLQVTMASGEVLPSNHQIAIKIGKLPTGKKLLTNQQSTWFGLRLKLRASSW